jgi:hypothetical protein
MKWPEWFEHGRSSETPTHEQILKLARKRVIFVSKFKPQPELRRKCEQLASEGFLNRISNNSYSIHKRII